jgi:cell wall-associated NlpC family hydrolase
MVIGFVALAVGVGTSTHAYAVPSPEELEQQIEAQWRVLEPIIEEYNGVNEQLKINRAKAEALKNQLQPLADQVDAAMGQVKVIAIAAYKNGRMGAVNALLSSDSPTKMADTLSKLDILARNQRAQVSGAAEIREKYGTDKKALDELIAQQAAREAELAAKKKEIEAKIAEMQRMRQAAFGGGGGTGNLKPSACPGEIPPGPAATAVRTACAQIGKPYVFGAEGPNQFDCSGLTMYSWQQAGKSIGARTADGQFGATNRVTKANLRAGDLIFFYSPISHVAIYVGGGWAVHASRAGVPVKMKNVSSDGSIVGYGRVKGT